MQLTVHGVHMDVGDTYQRRVEEALNSLSDKFKVDIISAHVQLSKNNTGFSTDIAAHIGRGMYLRGSEISHDALLSIDTAIEKLAIKLRKYKKRLVDHHRQRDLHIETGSAPYYVISQQESEDENIDPQSSAQPIIAETEEVIPLLTVSEAVFYFDLSDKVAMMFKNSGTGNLNMIYRRKDGNIGWVEAQ